MRKLLWAKREIRDFVSGLQKGTVKAVARELRRLQKGEQPLNYRVLSGFGVGVAELKRGKYRVAYTTEFPSAVGVAAAFKKDAKEGNTMRPEHERSIKSGLRRLREGEGVEAPELVKPTVH